MARRQKPVRLRRSCGSAMTTFRRGEPEGEKGKERKQMRRRHSWRGGRGGARSQGFWDLWGALLLGSISYGLRLLAEKIWATLSLLFQVWALVKKKRNLSRSSFQPFIQQPASILSMPLLGGGLYPWKMWALPNSWLVNRVIKSAMP